MLTSKKLALALAKIILFVGLFLCFIYQVELQVGKFLNKDTTLATRDIPVESLKYPIFTVCPDYPFKSESVEKARFSKHFWIAPSPEDWNKSMNLNNWNQFFNNSTYQVNEILSSIRLQNGSILREFEQVDNELITIKKIYTSYRGVCHSIVINLPATLSTDFVKIKFKHPTKDNNLHVFYHSTIEETYLMAFNYWITQPNMQILMANNAYNSELVIKKRVQKPQKRPCDIKGTIASEHLCIAKHFKEKCRPCQFPFFSMIQQIPGPDSNSTLCSNVQEIKNTGQCIKMAIIAFRETKCLRPCDLWILDLWTRQSSMHGRVENESSIALYFRHLEIEENKEYVLVDFITIVAAVGGSMGMFLGFSFLDFGLKFMYWLEVRSAGRS